MVTYLVFTVFIHALVLAAWPAVYVLPVDVASQFDINTCTRQKDNSSASSPNGYYLFN